MKKILKAILIVFLLIGFVFIMPNYSKQLDPGDIPCHVPDTHCPIEP